MNPFNNMDPHMVPGLHVGTLGFNKQSTKTPRDVIAQYTIHVGTVGGPYVTATIGEKDADAIIRELGIEGYAIKPSRPPVDNENS